MSCDFKIVDSNYLFIDDVILTPSTEDSAFPVSNLRHFFRSRVWRSTTTTAVLDIDLRAEEEIDAFAMLWDPSLEVKIGTAAVIKLQANATPSFASPAVDVTLTIDDDTETALHFFEELQSYRYWRLDISDSLNPYGYIEVPKLFLGRKSEFSKLPQQGFQLQLTDNSFVSTTAFGHRYVDSVPIRKSMTIDLKYFDKTDSELLWNSYNSNGNANPILLVLDGQEELFDKYRTTIYGRYPDSLTQEHVIRGLFNTSMIIEEVI